MPNFIAHYLDTEGITQTDLAQSINMRQATISDIVTGKTRKPRAKTKRKIAAFLGREVRTLFPRKK